MLPEESDIYLLITRHLAFQTSAAEDERLYAWIAESPENERLFQQLRQVWLSGRGNAEEEARAAGALTRLRTRLERETPSRTRLKRWLAAAAVASIATAAASFFLVTRRGPSVQDVQRIADAGHSLSFTMDDGTFVCLAPGSRISYPAGSGKGERRVVLRGQAYFEVTTNPHRPFAVESGGIRTEVLGTVFTVSAFDNQAKLSVALLKGSVRVTDSARLFNCLLEPNKELQYDKRTRETSIRAIDAGDNVEGWTRRELHFDNITLAGAASQLQAVYGVKLVFQDADASDCRIWGSFKNKPLDDILSTISLAGHIKFTQGPDGTVFVSKIK